MRNPIILTIFAICCAMAALLLAIIVAEPIANSGGLPHPTLPGVMVGGDGAARLEEIGGFAFAFQCLLLLLIVALCVLGVNERRRTPLLYGMLGLTYLFTLIIWWQMYYGHLDYLETGETGYFLGFPVATAWQMYGTWFGAIPLILIYTLGFRTYIHTDDDEAKYQQLLKDNGME